MLLLSGYIQYPRRSVYWEMKDDSWNSIVTSLFTRNKFLEALQYIHLADNNNLGTNGKLARVQLLFKILNENSLKNFIPGRNTSIDKLMVPYF